MSKKLQVISFDLDTTLADTTPRQHMIDRTKNNAQDFWDAYALACPSDLPGPAIPMAKFFTDTHVPWIIVSGRSEAARGVTRQWLRKHDLAPWAMFLCDDRHSYKPHGAWKATKLLEVQAQLGVDIVYHVDDYVDVAVETEKVGIKTVLVHDINSPVISQLG